MPKMDNTGRLFLILSLPLVLLLTLPLIQMTTEPTLDMLLETLRDKDVIAAILRSVGLSLTRRHSGLCHGHPDSLSSGPKRCAGKKGDRRDH